MNTETQKALDRIPNPVGLLLAGNKKDYSVITVSWFSQVSQEPPLVAVSVSPQSSIAPVLDKEKNFVLALLDGNQEHAARTCGHHQDVVADKIREANLTLTESQAVAAPAIKEALVNLECRITSQVPSGDHLLYLAEVQQANMSGRTGNQLVFADRDLFSL